jgi:hypothetical protein
MDQGRMVQFLALGLQIPEDDPDRRKYYSMQLRNTRANSTDIAEITLMSPGDILVLYSDGVYDGTDEETCARLEAVMREHFREPARGICDALLQDAVRRDEELRARREADVIDDKTVFVIKRA